MKKLNLHQVEDKLLSQNLKIFNATDMIVLFGVKKRAAQAFLAYNCQKGSLIRLKAGLFAFKRNFPDNFVLANRLYNPSYISLEKALSYYSLIPESIYSFTSVTTKPTREFEVNNLLFDYRRIKKEAFSGYQPARIGAAGETVFLATPEKAVADFLYFVALGKKEYNDRLKFKKINQKILFNCLNLFSSPKLVSLAKKLLLKYA